MLEVILVLAAVGGLASALSGSSSGSQSSSDSDSATSWPTSTPPTRFNSVNGLPEVAPGAGVDVLGTPMDVFPPSNPV